MTAGAYFLEVERKLYKSLNEAEMEEHNLWHDRIMAGPGSPPGTLMNILFRENAEMY